MPTFDAGEFHAGRRATLLLMLALFAFGAVSGWSGREIFDASRLPQTAQVAVAEPKEDERPAKSQQPEKETASQQVPDETSGSYPLTRNDAEAPPAQGKDVPYGRAGSSWTPADAKPAKVEEVDASQEKSPLLFYFLPKLAPEKPAELRLKPNESLRDFLERWRRFWFLDQPENADPLRTHGGMI